MMSPFMIHATVKLIENKINSNDSLFGSLKINSSIRIEYKIL
jgi:hypothetical protein